MCPYIALNSIRSVENDKEDKFSVYFRIQKYSFIWKSYIENQPFAIKPIILRTDSPMAAIKRPSRESPPRGHREGDTKEERKQEVVNLIVGMGLYLLGEQMICRD